MLSIDSCRKEKYEQMRVGLNYEQVMANIRGFFRLRDELRPKCIIRVRGVSFHDPTVAEDLAEIHHWEHFWDDMRKPHDRIYMKRAHTWGNQRAVEGHSPVYDWVYHPCVIPFSTMHVTAMGTTALCPQDFDATIELGDVNKNTIVEIWQGEKMREMRALHMSGNRNDISLCQGCRLFDEEFSLERNKDVWAGPAVPQPERLMNLDLDGISSPAKRLV